MTLSRNLTKALALFTLTGLFSMLALAQDGTIVLDTSSAWRSFSVLKPPQVKDAKGVRSASFQIAWLDAESAPAPTNWAAIAMDDSGWRRGPVGPMHEFSDTPMVSRLYLRGKFMVEDPSAVHNLTLNASYHGGIIVYLNGVEVGRAHVSQKGNSLAEDYPKEAFIDAAGKPVTAHPDKSQPQEKDGREKLWVRDAQIPLPAKALCKGLNVIGVEVIGAAQDAAVLDAKVVKGDKIFPNEFFEATCQVVKMQLTAQGNAGLSTCAYRPDGVRVWNADILASDSDADFPNAAEALRPVRIVGPRNGIFSGKVHVGSTKPIEGLSATVSELKGQGGVIPATAVAVRYGVQWGVAEWCALSPTCFHGISQTPMPKYPLGKPIGAAQAGAVAPVWVTVSIPKNTAPGTYNGVLTIKTAASSVPVPVTVKVLPWILPNAQDFQTWVDLIESPDTLAVEYKVPLWSEEHMKMIGDAFALISGTGSRTVYIPALAHTNLGNEESMIRWIKTGNNQYDWDFTIMDKYLDLAQKYLGTPKIVALQVWEIYMAKEAANYRFKASTRLGVPQVTFIDPVTKKTELGKLPALSDPESRAIWSKLLEQVQARLKKRGLEKALMLGMFCDQNPPKEDMQFFAAIAPKLAWVQQGHMMPQKVHDVDVGYNATVWGGYRFADGAKQSNQTLPPANESLQGWRRTHLDAVFERNLGLDEYPTVRWYFSPETAITSELRGVGRIGADYWKAVKNQRGVRSGYVNERFLEGSWGNTTISLIVPNAILSPGEKGPEATNRLLAFIEGVQMCEARIYLEQSLKSGLSGDLKTRCEGALNERLYDMWRALSTLSVSRGFGIATMWRWNQGIGGQRYFLGSNWQDKSENIYALANEIQQKSR